MSDPFLYYNSKIEAELDKPEEDRNQDKLADWRAERAKLQSGKNTFLLSRSEYAFCLFCCVLTMFFQHFSFIYSAHSLDFPALPPPSSSSCPRR